MGTAKKNSLNGLLVRLERYPNKVYTIKISRGREISGAAAVIRQTVTAEELRYAVFGDITADKTKYTAYSPTYIKSLL